MAASDAPAVVLQFLDGTVHVPDCDDAYLRVRLADPVQPTAAANVYLPDGTALVVPAGALVRCAHADTRS